MFSKEYADYIICYQTDKEIRNEALGIIAIVPDNGILTFSTKQISRKIKIPEVRVNEVLEKMKNHKIPLFKEINGALIFDYSERNIEYVRHLRNALGNIGWNE